MFEVIKVGIELNVDELPRFAAFMRDIEDARELAYQREVAAAVAEVTQTPLAPEPVNEQIELPLPVEMLGAPVAYTLEDAVNSLKAYLAKTNNSTFAVELLREFGAGRVTELQDEQRGAFIARLNAA